MQEREQINLHGWQEWLSLFVAVGILVAATIQAALPGHSVGAIVCVWLSLLVLLQAYRLRGRRSHDELVQEVHVLRQELEQRRDRTNR